MRSDKLVKGKCVVCDAVFESRFDKKTCSDTCRKRLSRQPEKKVVYDASCIKIKPDDTEAYYWEKVGILASDFNRDPGWIERGLEACERAGVSHQYFVDRYLLKKDVPFHEGVDAASREVQKEWRDNKHGYYSKMVNFGKQLNDEDLKTKLNEEENEY